MMHCVRSILSVVRQSREKIIPLQGTLHVNKIQYDYQIPRCYLSQNVNDTDAIVEDICKGNADLEKKLRILMLEVEVMRQDGRYAPDKITRDQWEHLIQLHSKNQRVNHLRYLFKTEKAKENSKARKEARKQEMLTKKPEDLKENEDDLLYGIQHQSLFLRIRDQSINQFDNYRALQAMMYSQPVIIDCSYEDDMVHKEVLNAAKQATFAFGDNRIHKDPFNLHLCNINVKGPFMKQMRKNIPSLEEPWFPLNLHTESYLDLFPKEKLVYLTPHCREELTRFDHDAVYIIGCMVDKINNDPLSLARAKRDGIKMAKLPLDRYLEWAPGSKKNLNINHMVPILLDLRLTGDWEYALRHIPRRKLMETKIKAMEKRFQKNPKLKNALLQNFTTKSSFSEKKANVLTFREKRLNNMRNDENKLKTMDLRQNKLKSKRSLYDDENI